MNKNFFKKNKQLFKILLTTSKVKITKVLVVNTKLKKENKL